MKNILQQQKEKNSIIGKYKFTIAKISNKLQYELLEKINKLKKEKKEYINYVRKLNKICNTQIFEHNNIIPTIGKTMIINNLTNNSPDNTMVVTHIAIGTGTTTPANGDTTLVTETYRNAVASKTNSSNVGYITGFFNATETSGTFTEAGIFSDGTGTIDSGILVSRVLLNSPTGIIKSNTQTLTIDWIVQLN